MTQEKQWKCGLGVKIVSASKIEVYSCGEGMVAMGVIAPKRVEGVILIMKMQLLGV